MQIQEDSELLSEVVVLGYSRVRKEDLTGSVGVVSEEALKDQSLTDTKQLLQGRVAGVQVVNNSGLPGSGARVVIRGTGTFTNAEPLYVIDGIQGGDINAINPNDIESLTVLKDASSVAIYGAAGANGVVIITTKSGKSGAPQLTYNAYYGVASPWKKLDLLNAAQYTELVRDIAAIDDTPLPPKFSTNEVNQDVTDWQDVVFRDGQLTEHHLGLSGGAENITYNISAAYNYQEGVVIDRNFERGNLRFNIQEKFFNGRFRLGQNVLLKYEKRENNAADFINALRMPPYAPTLDPNNLGGFSRVTTTDDLNDAFNPLPEVKLSEVNNQNFGLNGQFFAELDVIEGLTLRSQLAVRGGFSDNYNFRDEFANGQLIFAQQLQQSNGWGYGIVFENTANFTKTFGVNNLTVLVGNSYLPDGRSRFNQIIGSDFPNGEIRQLNAAGTTTLNGASANSGVSKLSYFGRVNYGLLNRYLFTFTVRRDGSSVFGPANRWGNFPSLAFAWKAHEEDFLRGLANISELKFRASWGITGNDAIPAFATDPLVWRGSANNVGAAFGISENQIFGASVISVPNPFLQWEETTQVDVGLDLGLFDDRILFTFDYYNRLNEKLLTFTRIPISTGLGQPGQLPSILENAASASNTGVELSLTYQGGGNSDFSYSITGNLAYNQNEVISLGDEEAGAITGGGFAEVASITRTEPGNPLGAFYGFRVDEIARDQAQIDALNAAASSATGGEVSEFQEGLLPGDIIFRDLNVDGFVNEDDQEFLGSPIPKWTYGGAINLNYKNIDFNLTLQGVGGVEVVNALDYWLEGMSRPFNSNTDVLDRWRNPGDEASLPRAGQNATGGGNLRPSDRYVEDGSFMRVRNLTIGYTFPTNGINGVSRLRLYVSGQNLLTFTNYSGYDPEISQSGNDFIFSRGIDFGQYPQPRSFYFGVNVGF
ncbi:MAG: TonB-dependent receptor [Bacteroidota bacterium]